FAKDPAMATSRKSGNTGISRLTQALADLFRLAFRSDNHIVSSSTSVATSAGPGATTADEGQSAERAGDRTYAKCLAPPPERAPFLDQLTVEAGALRHFVNSERRKRLVELAGQDVVDQFIRGFGEYCREGQTEFSAYLAMRKLAMVWKGTSDDFFYGGESSA